MITNKLMSELQWCAKDKDRELTLTSKDAKAIMSLFVDCTPIFKTSVATPYPIHKLTIR